MQRTLALSCAAQCRTITLAAVAMSLVSVFMPAVIMPAAAAPDDPWISIRKEFYGDRQIVVTKVPLILDAPDKAEDAALVPVSIYLLPEIADNIKTLRVFIDNNPMPMVGTFTFGKAAGFGPKTIATRVRFDTLSDIRAIVETDDGKLYMATRFVQASGGCSSPAIKDTQEALDSAGQMHVKKAERSAQICLKQKYLICHGRSHGDVAPPELFRHADGPGKRAVHSRQILAYA